MFRSLSIFVLAVGLAMACATTAARAEAADRYVEAGAMLRSDAEVEAWYGLVVQLRRNFDDICGDTFCEGDYSNIQSLRFQCSVDRFGGRVGQCAWSFAASNESVDPANGVIDVQRAFWTCRMPLAAGTTLDRLMKALQGERPLYATLPGTDKSMLDGLIGCL